MRDGADNWGPWAVDITPAERLARLRSLRTIAQLTQGKIAPIVKALLLVESLEDADLDAALVALNAMPALKQRHLTASYIAVNHPPRSAA